MTETRDGEPLSIGRKSRVVPKGIERAVHSRDKNTCRFPGCCNKRFVDIHHIEHWANGGETAVERYENSPRGGLLSAVEKLVNEPPPPRYFH